MSFRDKKNEFGRYSIACWEDAVVYKDCDVEEYFDSIDKMDAEALRLLRGGRFKYIETYEWSAENGQWEELDVYTTADV